jgi:hypothetical protein
MPPKLTRPIVLSIARSPAPRRGPFNLRRRLEGQTVRRHPHSRRKLVAIWPGAWEGYLDEIGLPALLREEASIRRRAFRPDDGQPVLPKRPVDLRRRAPSLRGHFQYIGSISVPRLGADQLVPVTRIWSSDIAVECSLVLSLRGSGRRKDGRQQTAEDGGDSLGYILPFRSVMDKERSIPP